MMSSSSNSSSIDVSTVLYHLNDASEGAQLEQLKLALECLGIGQGKVDKVNSVHDAYNCLCCEQSTANEAIPLLYAVLEEIAVPVRVLWGLKKWTTTEKLKECWKRKDFNFAKMIIKLCNEFTQEDFAKFCQLCLVHLDHTVNSDHCNTIVKLFQKLIRAKKVVHPGSVQVLSEILTEMQKESSLVYVQEYNRVIGNLSEATQEGSLEDALPIPGTSEQQDVMTGVDSTITFEAAISIEQQRRGQQSLVVGNSTQYTQRQSCTDIRNGYGTEEAQRPDHIGRSQVKAFTTPNNPTGSTPHVDSSPTDSEPFQTDSGISPQQNSGVEIFVNDPGVFGGNQDIEVDGGNDKKKEESKPLIDEMRTDSPKLFNKKNKMLLIGCIAIAVLTVLFAGSAAMVGKGILLYLKHSAIIDNNTLNMTTLFAVEGDTIVLGMVNTGVVSKVTVEETTERGDSSHVSSVFLVRQNDLKKHSVSISKHFRGFYSKRSWRTTGLIDHTYILGGGLINYSFCATHPSEGTGDGFIYIFNSEKHYSDYSAQVPGSQAFFSVYKEKLNIGTFNQSECRSLEFPIADPGYYFVVVDTPGDLYYNYSYEIRDIHLDHMDYDSVCEQVYEGQACSFDLPTEVGCYSVLAYVTPHVDLESHTTHLRLMTSGVTKTIKYELTMSVVLFCFGGGVLLLCFVLAVFVIVCALRQKKLQYRRLLFLSV